MVYAMNCEDLEKDIYLYGELSAGERAAVDRHVATCAGCRALLEDVQQQHVLTRQAVALRPQAQDPARLTAAIMAAIAPARRKHVIMDSAWLRYGMAAASVLLIVAFCLEQPWAQGERGERIAASPPLPAHSPVMDTRVLLANRRQHRGETPRSLITLYATCTHHNDCYNEAVRNLKTRMKL